MILAGFFQTVEFYIIAALTAAAIVAYMSIPRARGEVVTHTVAGELQEGEPLPEGELGRVVVKCRDDGSVELTRSGISGVSMDGAVSLAVNVAGFDIHIEERRVRGSYGEGQAESATFVLDFLAPEWYHIRYAYSDAGEYCAFQLHVKPGITVRRDIRR